VCIKNCKSAYTCFDKILSSSGGSQSKVHKVLSAIRMLKCQTLGSQTHKVTVTAHRTKCSNTEILKCYAFCCVTLIKGFTHTHTHTHTPTHTRRNAHIPSTHKNKCKQNLQQHTWCLQDSGMTPCWLVICYRCFGGAFCLHLQVLHRLPWRWTHLIKPWIV
jgi:hypothetical protein